jgi:hypothetical protein
MILPPALPRPSPRDIRRQTDASPSRRGPDTNTRVANAPAADTRAADEARPVGTRAANARAAGTRAAIEQVAVEQAIGGRSARAPAADAMIPTAGANVPAVYAPVRSVSSTSSVAAR